MGFEFSELLDRTEAHLESERLHGWDPYDALCSPLFDMPVLRSQRVLRFGAQQVLKRVPWNHRPLLRIEKQLNPVAVALYAQGQCLRAISEPETAGTRRRAVAAAIEHAPCVGVDGLFRRLLGLPSSTGKHVTPRFRAARQPSSQPAW